MGGSASEVPEAYAREKRSENYIFGPNFKSCELQLRLTAQATARLTATEQCNEAQAIGKVNEKRLP